MILGRITNKANFVDTLGVNNLMDDISKTKMAIEAELDEIRQVKDESHKAVEFSKKDALKMEERLKGVLLKKATCEMAQN